MNKSGIKHMVIFNLKDQSPTVANQFLADSRSILSGIPGVREFEVVCQVSSKNDFTYGFSMYFDNADDYRNYNDHPSHAIYLEKYWMVYVLNFLEIDFQLYMQH